jgi:hypothetical protein
MEKSQVSGLDMGDKGLLAVLKGFEFLSNLYPVSHGLLELYPAGFALTGPKDSSPGSS